MTALVAPAFSQVVISLMIPSMAARGDAGLSEFTVTARVLVEMAQDKPIVVGLHPDDDCRFRLDTDGDVPAIRHTRREVRNPILR